ncbi:MAG TPA: UDP-N-acetylglucosamine 2-epimerase (non-hydrolyzing) [Haliscomenobacter sp.]|uniref:non-hydrolyzing UDP-N-acetylglucosamine 2-epimerase n=1 Tax=Haliscomenobacter sp. TaxID=2717303 RepID=UPI002B8D9CCE|nr:UDP-N-acetylglucosamine 2-epimerase (non-hydrolyzing) [Haliscomenobacter sp.]HOY15833.1 UDP-N-acetylglucosamine 2-epimerase (non-hydrolyzing) [Haliscomenobacter sp.]HPH20799.1 UDP-N-acetylglucosamine 2-epimerase (non-hydrolyzing) [Haliscomenobacter sp.]
MKILNIVGARPNFMKVAPLHRAFQRQAELESKIVHTGQHYDAKMSEVFFTQLELPNPDYFLGIGGGSHTQQTAKIMLAFEEVLQKEQPDLVLVVGDVNSTIACALVAVKMNIPVAHVEAGLRSGDRGMPEEINRILTDSISDFLFVTEMSGMINLAKENVPDERVFFIGNCMIDSLVHYRERAQRLSYAEILPGKPSLQDQSYVLMTMHRPSNVDFQEGLEAILSIIEDTAQYRQVVFPVHPRTLKNLETYGLLKRFEQISNLITTEPLGYLEFLRLMEGAALVITDSGGIQEETTFLQTPCLTFRSSTERPITVELGTNTLLADLNPDTVHHHLLAVLDGRGKKGSIPPFWDGHAAERIANVLMKLKS